MQMYFIFLLVLWIGHTIYILKQKNKLYRQLYSQSILAVTIMVIPFITSIQGVRMGELSIAFPIGIIMVAILLILWELKNNKHKYYVNTTKQEELIKIITTFLKNNKIKYEIEKSELPAIHLLESKKSIDFFGYKTICINLKQIKDLSFYNELVTDISSKVKNLN